MIIDDIKEDGKWKETGDTTHDYVMCRQPRGFSLFSLSSDFTVIFHNKSTTVFHGLVLDISNMPENFKIYLNPTILAACEFGCDLRPPQVAEFGTKQLNAAIRKGVY